MATAAAQAHSNVSNVISLKDPSAVMDMYATWAQKYDEDVGKINYKCHESVTEQMDKIITDKNVKILDIGAGTGLLGIQLRRSGYNHIDAIEPSQAMMDRAAELGIYERQIVDFVTTSRLDIDDATYDVITGAGCFVPGHIPIDALDELNRITKPGGLLFLTCSERYYEKYHDNYAPNLDKKIEQVIGDGVWTLERKVKAPYLDHYNANITIVRKK